MRIRNHLRRLRGPRSLGDVHAITEIPKGWLSMFERGHALPNDRQVDRMIEVYGHPHDWYPASVRRVLDIDLRHCRHCGEELAPDSLRSRRYHPDCPQRPMKPPSLALASVSLNAPGDA